jgi:peptidoglycan/LPS O-acetylase OafA/YrhL
MRNQSLDFLRAMAIFLVLGSHISPYFGNDQFLARISQIWERGGWVGVDLFFVLSGFLISGLLFKEHRQTGKISFKKFFIKRGFKIYPAFYLMLCLTLSLKYPFKIHNLLIEIFFLQDYQYGLWQHTWSLGVEEKFYVLLPLLLIAMYKTSRSKLSPFKMIPMTFIFAATICYALRLINALANPYTLQTHQYPFHLRFDSLYWGVVLSFYYHYHPEEFKAITKKFRILFLFIGLLFLWPAFLFHVEKSPLIYTAGFIFIYLGSGLILMAMIDYKLPSWPVCQAISYIGSRSYSIYLWHIPFFPILFYLFEKFASNYLTWENFFAVYVLGSLLIGIFMANLIEFPILRIREKLYPDLSSISKQ